MQRQWAEANIRSETKDTPVGSQRGISSYYLGEVILIHTLFKAISKLGVVLSCCVHQVMIKALTVCLFTEEGCKASGSSHNMTRHRAGLALSMLSWPCYRCHSHSIYSWEGKDKFFLMYTTRFIFHRARWGFPRHAHPPLFSNKPEQSQWALFFPELEWKLLFWRNKLYSFNLQLFIG